MNPNNKNLIDVKTSISVIFNKENSNDGRFLRVLKKAGVKTIEDLCRHAETDLLAIKQIGQYCINKIADFLKEHELGLGMTEEQLSSYTKAFDSISTAESTAETSDKEPAADANGADDESSEEFMQILCSIADAAAAKAQEHRRYELAKELFLTEKASFITTEERAANAIEKADIFLAAYYGNPS